MSSVLAPIGPLPPRVYWTRRLVVFGIPLILITIIAVSCSGGSKSPSAGTGGTPNAGSTTPSSTGGGGAACTPADLSAVLSTSASIYTVGQQPQFSAKITNVSALPCQLKTSPSTETWTVSSGTEPWWTTGATSGCAVSNVVTNKTLNAGASRKVTVTWDGHRQLPGCKADVAASPGTYHLDATLDGVAAQQVTFHFTKNTQ